MMDFKNLSGRIKTSKLVSKMKFLGYLSFMLLIIVGCKQSKDASELFSSKWKVFHHVDHEKCRLDTIEKIPGSMQGKQGFIQGKTIRMSDSTLNFGQHVDNFQKHDLAVAFATLTLDSAVKLPVRASADWWMEWYANGEQVYSTFNNGNEGPSSDISRHQFELPLEKGKNLIAVKVKAGRAGWFFRAANATGFKKEGTREEVIRQFYSDAARSNGFPNTIELRNDSNGDEYFMATIQMRAERPVFQYFLKSKQPDVWEGSSRERYGTVYYERPAWGIYIEYKKADGYAKGTNKKVALLNIDNIKSPYYYEYIHPTRSSRKQTKSNTFSNSAKDWDYLVNKKNEILKKAGLTDQSPDLDKVNAVALACWEQRVKISNQKQDGTQSMPVDFWEHGEFCAGAANALVAICSIMEIPARVIGYRGHANAEVLINGKWHLVENTVKIVKHTRDSLGEGPVYDYNLNELILNPPLHGQALDFFAEDGRGNWFLEYFPTSYSWWEFWVADKWNVRVSASKRSVLELSTLYPDQKSLKYICKGQQPILWLTPPIEGKIKTSAKLRKNLRTRQIVQQHGLRQDFALPKSLSGAKHIVSKLYFLDGNKHNMPEDGGDWYYLINGKKYYLRDHGGWDMSEKWSNNGIEGKVLRFELPVKAIL